MLAIHGLVHALPMLPLGCFAVSKRLRQDEQTRQNDDEHASANSGFAGGHHERGVSHPNSCKASEMEIEPRHFRTKSGTVEVGRSNFRFRTGSSLSTREHHPTKDKENLCNEVTPGVGC